jgi:cell division protease FtsH
LRASSDIKTATKLAKDMVTKFGMSTELGPLSYGANEDEIFLGFPNWAKNKNKSEQASN